MNIGKLAMDSVVSLEIEPQVVNPTLFKEREIQLVKLIEACREVQKTKGWSSLKQVFDTLPSSLENQLMMEAKKLTPDTNKLNRLSGELKWAERFSDLSKLEESFKVELNNVRQQLYGKTTQES